MIYLFKAKIYTLRKLFAAFDCSLDGRKKCDNGVQCVPLEAWCDGYNDCRDNSDEDETKCRGNSIIVSYYLPRDGVIPVK